MNHLNLSNRGRFLLYIFFQFSIILTNYIFYRFPDEGVYAYYTIQAIPLIELLSFGFLIQGGKSVLKSLSSILWISVFFFGIVFWAYAIFVTQVNITHEELLYLIEIIYFPAFVEQFNFSVIGVEIGSTILKKGSAALLAVFFYGLYYFVILINDVRGFPGIYFWFFILDSVGVGIIYITLYSVSKSIWLPMIVEISFIMSVIFIPPLPAAFFYTFVPS